MLILTDRHGNPVEPPHGYLDAEGSTICAVCALASNTEDEVPQFRPSVPIDDPMPGERCDQCSQLLDPDLPEEEEPE